MPENGFHISWELIRINAASMGWPYVIGKETLLHMQAMANESDLSHYQTLHMFYEKVATPEERKQMLRACYKPVC